MRRAFLLLEMFGLTSNQNQIRFIISPRRSVNKKENYQTTAKKHLNTA